MVQNDTLDFNSGFLFIISEAKWVHGDGVCKVYGGTYSCSWLEGSKNGKVTGLHCQPNLAVSPGASKAQRSVSTHGRSSNLNVNAYDLLMKWL